MKNLAILLCLIFSLNAFAQRVVKVQKVSDHSIHVVGDNFEGIVFNDSSCSEFLGLDSNEVKKVRVFTPTKTQLNLAERILYSQIKDVDRTHKYRNGLDIYDHWGRYKHQYIFYIDQKGEKFIYINCFSIDNNNWSKKTTTFMNDKSIQRWYNDLIYAFDGGDSYWRAKINLQTKRIFEFEINGSPISS